MSRGGYVRPDKMIRRRWGQSIVVLGAFGSACLVPIPVLAQDGAWTRTTRTGGETWTYRFTVAGGPNPAGNALVAGGPSDRGAEAPRSRAPVGGRKVDGPPPTAAGSAAAAVDIEAQRAYLNTATAGEGDEVVTPVVGQTVYFHLDYSVVGATAPIDISRRAMIDGASFCDFTSSTATGDYFTWCADGWVTTAGAHTLRWDLDFDNTVAESNESNNSTSKSWTSAATAGIDIQAERAYLDTAAGGEGSEVTTPVVGQTVYFHLDYSVVGSGGAVTVDRRAIIDGQTFCDFSGTPTPGAYLTWCMDAWPVTAGSHTLHWDLDYNNTVAETNESNNSAATLWTSAPAGTVDLEAQRAYLNTQPSAAGDEVSTPTVGQAVYFHLDYSLIGAGGAVAVERRAVLDEETFCSFTGSPTPGDYFTWCADSWTAIAGSHKLRWDLDFNNTVPESNEDNNSASMTWASGGGSCSGDCNGDSEVTVNELITMVNVALGNTASSVCSAGDVNGDGEVTVNEIVAGVNRALSGCG